MYCIFEQYVLSKNYSCEKLFLNETILNKVFNSHMSYLTHETGRTLDETISYNILRPSICSFLLHLRLNWKETLKLISPKHWKQLNGPSYLSIFVLFQFHFAICYCNLTMVIRQFKLSSMLPFYFVIINDTFFYAAFLFCYY